MHYTSSQANMPHAIAGAMQRRAMSGMGIIATPYFPYDVNSVWNRNQLGNLNLSSPMTWVGIGLAVWMFMKYRHRLGV